MVGTMQTLNFDKNKYDIIKQSLDYQMSEIIKEYDKPQNNINYSKIMQVSNNGENTPSFNVNLQINP